MTGVPRSTLRVFLDFPFETLLAVSMLLLAGGALISGINPSGALEGALDGLLYATWRWAWVVSSLGVLASLLARPWAGRRRRPANRERWLALLRTYEAASCVGMGLGLAVYAIVVSADRLDNSAFASAATAALGLAFWLRAYTLIRENRRRLVHLQLVNESTD